MKYFVSYNGQYMAEYKSVKSCLNFVNRKGWKNDESNLLYIVDEEGEEYDTVTGEQIQDDVEVKGLTDKEFDTLVDMMVDHDMDFELIPLEENGVKVVVLKFNDNSFFKCLLTDFDKAVNYINDPSSLDNY